ncbi:MAG TPA: tetratricopeptide repeat protein [Alphaproteobacteria bacterium]|nr:tetratricopeptide repeat protein [Alphaproteobacteria bacterium]
MIRGFIFCLSALALCSAALAQPLADAERYVACMDRARSAPAEGLTEADLWLAEAETFAARHCRAVSLIGLGREEEAVAALDALGRRMEERDPTLAADLYRQAAMVLFDMERLDAAEDMQNRALRLAPDSVELLIDRALLEGTREDYAKALQTLEHARSLAPANPDVLVLMASAHRLLDHADLAQERLGAALAIDPDHPGALLERGILRRLSGDRESARADWERVRTLAPDSPEAETAAANIRLLDQSEATDTPPE